MDKFLAHLESTLDAPVGAIRSETLEFIYRLSNAWLLSRFS